MCRRPALLTSMDDDYQLGLISSSNNDISRGVVSIRIWTTNHLMASNSNDTTTTNLI